MLQRSGTVVKWVGVALLCAPGCIWIYDPDELSGKSDGDGADGDGSDGSDDDGVQPDGGPTPDADPDALDFQLVPGEVFEGEGSAFDEADLALVRPIALVLRGQNLSDDMIITLDGAGFDAAVVEELAVSPDGRWAALSLRVPVLPDLAQGMNDTIEVRVQSFEDVTRSLTVRGLDSFERSGGLIDTDTTALRARYSHVALSGDISARGTAPLRLFGTAGVTVAGSLRVDAAGRAPGAGGCEGGPIGMTPSCGAAAGKAGPNLHGGGGGGFGSAGGPGTGGAAGGSLAADATLVPLPPASGSTARGAGGGGGGPLLDLAGGGAGGGGGGVVELTTPAVLRVADAALLSAGGATGTPTGGAGCLLAGGSGGSGSGGAILLRAGASMVSGAGAQVRAVGGPQVGPVNCRGGAGGVGRIRIDSADPIEIADEPSALVGPMITRDAPVVTRTQTIAISVRGAESASYELYLGEASNPAGSIALGTGGMGSSDVTLEPGLNAICVSGSSADELAYLEAKNCLSVAYVPADD